MGWLFYNSTMLLPNGKVDRKAEINSGFSQGYSVVKSSMVGTVYYGAIKKESTGEIFGSVILTSKNGSYNFGYKSMDESYGPYESKCPLSILNILTPTDNESANRWRQRCRDYHEQKKSPTAFANLPVGTNVIWTIPSDRFTCGKKGEKVGLTKTKRHKSRAYWFCISGNWRISPKYVDMTNCEIQGYGEGAE